MLLIFLSNLRMQDVPTTSQFASESWMNIGRKIYYHGNDDKSIRSAFPSLVRRPIFLILGVLVLVICSILFFEKIEHQPRRRDTSTPSPKLGRGAASRQADVSKGFKSSFQSYGPDSITSWRRRRSRPAAEILRANIVARQLERKMGLLKGEE